MVACRPCHNQVSNQFPSSIQIDRRGVECTFRPLIPKGEDREQFFLFPSTHLMHKLGKAAGRLARRNFNWVRRHPSTI